MKKPKFSFPLILLCSSLCFVVLVSGFRTILPGTKGLSVESKTVSSGTKYTLFYQNDLRMDVSLKRPDKNDKNIHLVIAGAYTLLDNYSVDGLYIDNGTVHNKNSVNHTLGGAVKIINGNAEIFPTGKGKLLNDSLIRLVKAQKGSLFQQIQLIEKGSGAKYKDVKLFQRRAIVNLKGKRTAVIESFEHITLAAFTKDLLELGAVDALYTDMGSWDEGWYRDPATSKTVTIGRLRAQTDKQCNWVIFKSK